MPPAFIGLFLILIRIINSTAHPRHHEQQHQQQHNNNHRLPDLSDFSDDVQNYLMEFGYLPKTNIETGNLRSETQLRTSIKELQKFGNIPQSGIIDDRTKKLLRTARCGVPDFDTKDFESGNHRHRRTRYPRFVVQGPKWDNLNVTWSLVNQTMTNGLSVGLTRRILHEALDVWSKNSKLNFQEVYSEEADIQVLFAKRHHGDGYDFDGPGSVLAHAFYPGSGRGGDAHFDEEEYWELDEDENSLKGTSLRNVAVHEFGHSLGLGHSSVQGAIMFPWYHGYRGDNDLPEDDKIAIQEIYGPREGTKQWGSNRRQHHVTTTTTRKPTTITTRRYYPDRRYDNDGSRRTVYYPERPRVDSVPERPYNPRYYPTTTTTTSSTTVAPRNRHHNRNHNTNKHKTGTNTKPDTCNTSYDAITVIRGEVFIFKGQYLWRIGEQGLVGGYPHEITKMWRQLPGQLTHIDSAYENKKRQIVFFIGKYFYVFHSNVLLPGYPKPLSDLGLPSSLPKLDAALVWGHNNRTYFYSGTMYWRFDEDEGKVELDYPRDMSMWRGIGYDIDTAFQYKDGKTYFFKGKGYWQFNDYNMRVQHEVQKKSAPTWMGCNPRDETRKQHLKARDEEMEDDDDDDEDYYFERDFETRTLIGSSSMIIIFNKSLIVLATIILITDRTLMRNSR